MEIILFFKGIFVGFLIAAPVGPVGILCAQRTLQISLLAGLVSGFGAALADTIFGAVAAFGLTFVARYLLENEELMRLIGGLLLVGIGVETMLKKPVTIQSDKLPKAHRYAASFFRTFMLTITNPITIMAFGPVFVAANAVVEEGNLVQAWALLFGLGLVVLDAVQRRASRPASPERPAHALDEPDLRHRHRLLRRDGGGEPDPRRQAALRRERHRGGLQAGDRQAQGSAPARRRRRRGRPSGDQRRHDGRRAEAGYETAGNEIGRQAAFAI